MHSLRCTCLGASSGAREVYSPSQSPCTYSGARALVQAPVRGKSISPVDHHALTPVHVPRCKLRCEASLLAQSIIMLSHRCTCLGATSGARQVYSPSRSSCTHSGARALVQAPVRGKSIRRVNHHAITPVHVPWCKLRCEASLLAQSITMHLLRCTCLGASSGARQVY